MTAAAAGGDQGARSYGAGARILSLGLALTGVVTMAFFALASHALGDETAYGHVSILWAVTFLITSVIYRPIEQLLARSIAESRARGAAHALRTPLILQATAAVSFVVAALLAKGWLTDSVLGGEHELFWVLLGAVTAYSLSYFARGFLAWSGRPELYGALVFIESSTRCLFPIVALVGLSHGTLAVAAGIAAAPLISLAVVPLALRGGVAAPSTGTPEQWDATPGEADFQVIEAEAGSPATGAENLTLRAGAVLRRLDGDRDARRATPHHRRHDRNRARHDRRRIGRRRPRRHDGRCRRGRRVQRVLVSRAPLQSLPGRAVDAPPPPRRPVDERRPGRGGQGAAHDDARDRGFAGSVTLGLLVLGPWAMDLLFPSDYDYAAGTLALVGLGMGLHLAAGTLNQSALAHGRAPVAAAVWAVAAAISLVWLIAKPVDEPVARAASAYVVAAAVLFAGLLLVERRSLRASE